MSDEFEIARTYGATAYLVYKFLQVNPNASILDIQIDTGLSDNSVKAKIKLLFDANLLNRRLQFLNMSKGYRYTTVGLQ